MEPHQLLPDRAFSVGQVCDGFGICLGWCLMCHSASKDFGGLMAARFFLGVGEAAIAPGFSLITGMFYKREEQPARYLHINF